MFQKLETVEERCIKLDNLLSDSKVIKDQKSFQKYAKERSELSELLETYKKYKKIDKELAESAQLIIEGDEEIKQLAKMEAHKLQHDRSMLEEKLKFLLLGRDGLL